MDTGVAALGAIALHPFVRGSPRPSNGEFMRIVRIKSYRFALDVQRVKSGDELLALARATVQPWARAAQDLGEEHCRREFFDALDTAGRAGETALGSAASLCRHADRADKPTEDVLKRARLRGKSGWRVPTVTADSLGSCGPQKLLC